MSFTIKIADINDPATELAIRELIKSVNTTSQLLPERFLVNNLTSNASKKSFFLVAEEDGQIIGCNGFLANDFILNDNWYAGYQSCWSATHPLQQGRKIFTTIINEAKKILKEQNAGFLYGIANNRSNPIFTTKLGFTETSSLVLRIPNIPGIWQFRLNDAALLNSSNVCMINEKQVMEHKHMQYPADVKVIRFRQSWLWGKLLNKKKFGINWPVFYVGGVHLDSEKDLKGLIAAVFSSYVVVMVQFFSCANNTFNPLLKGWKKSKMNGFIFHNLNMPVFEHFNMMIGALDIF